MPSVLKGRDMVIWECFKRKFNFHTWAVPVLLPEEDESDEWPGMIGNNFEIHDSNVMIGDGETAYDIHREWHGWKYDYEDVQWLTDPVHEELQLNYMTVRFKDIYMNRKLTYINFSTETRLHTRRRTPTVRS